MPNKDSEVFQGSATTDAAPDAQATLVDNSEPLVDDASTKDLDRIAPEDTLLSDASKAVEDAAQAVMTPRRVQTLVVRPDGTISPAGDTSNIEEQTSVAPVTDDDAERLLPSSTQDIASDIAAVPQRSVQTVVVRDNEIQRTEPQSEIQTETQPETQAQDITEPENQEITSAQTDIVQPEAPQPATPNINNQTTPEVLPIVPSRPATQPLNVVNSGTEVAAVQISSTPQIVTPQPTNIAAGTYFMQIASTTNQADAQATGNRLTRQFASIVGNRGFVIRRADIEGRGTFYRVRVPGGTRNEASTLCSRYKAAGGNCFIAR